MDKENEVNGLMNERMEGKVEEYQEILKKIKAYNEAINVMYWDLRTGSPKKSVEGRSEAIGTLSSDVFNLTTSEEMGDILEKLLQDDVEGELDQVTLKSLQETKREYDRSKKIPAEMYKEYVVLVSKAESAWEQAKEKSKFKIFKPYLEEIVKYNREFVEYWGYEGDKYNALLDQYEPGMTVEQLDPIFEDLKQQLVPLLKEVMDAEKIFTKFLRKHYEIDKQRQFSLYILKKMGYDFKAGRLDEAVHPFQITLNSGDARVTTKFDENDITVGLFSTMHEGGHAQYEQNISDDLESTVLFEGASMGIHESQSRFWENIIGRSDDFWGFYYKDLVKQFSNQLEGISGRDFFRAINEIKPSLIRIDADELTYNFHIMIRYEIEKDLINGRINVEELPEIWNQKMEEYLGIVPENDAEGVLQDVHWSNGLFGYFPTYALGNIYSAQFYNKLKEDIPECKDMLKLGNLIPIKAWLNKNIHEYGKMKTPNELLMDVTGEPLNAKYFIEYLSEKIQDVYQLEKQEEE